MTDFESAKTTDGFSMKLWRGERMCLIAFDVADPEPDLVGFAIECRFPGETQFKPLLNRLAFSYDAPVETEVNGDRKFPSTSAPFQKFRWVHFPFDPQAATYTYRGTKMHMRQDGTLQKGRSIDPSRSPRSLTTSSSTWASRAGSPPRRPSATSSPTHPTSMPSGRSSSPASADTGLGFQKMAGDIYSWLGFEAYDLIVRFLDGVVADPSVSLDVFAYDFNEPDILARLEQLGPRLRISSW
jgi:hypothetical protein